MQKTDESVHTKAETLDLKANIALLLAELQELSFSDEECNLLTDKCDSISTIYISMICSIVNFSGIEKNAKKAIYKNALVVLSQLISANRHLMVYSDTFQESEYELLKNIDAWLNTETDSMASFVASMVTDLGPSFVAVDG